MIIKLQIESNSSEKSSHLRRYLLALLEKLGFVVHLDLYRTHNGVVNYYDYTEKELWSSLTAIQNVEDSYTKESKFESLVDETMQTLLSERLKAETLNNSK